MLERELEKKCLRIAKRHRCRFYKFVSPGNKGVFDRILIVPGGQIIFVELKSARGVVSKVQQKFQRDITAMGCHAVVIRTAEKFEELIEKAC